MNEKTEAMIEALSVEIINSDDPETMLATVILTLTGNVTAAATE